MIRGRGAVVAWMAAGLIWAGCGDGSAPGAADAGEPETHEADVGGELPDVPEVAKADAAPVISIPDPPQGGTQLIYDVDGAFDSVETFFDFPFPADNRLKSDGTPDVRGMPNPTELDLVAGLIETAGQRPGWTTHPVVWFRFDAPLVGRDMHEVIAPEATSPVLLVDIDPGSATRGALYPTVAGTLEADNHTPEHMLGVAPRPGFVLRPGHQYAVLVRRDLGDAAGDPLGVPAGLWTLLHGGTPEGRHGEALRGQLSPLLETLEILGIEPAEIAAATTFTTADVVGDLADMVQRVRETYSATIDAGSLRVDPDDGADHDRLCELVGTISMPQFQVGVPPFDAEGLFELDATGLPIEQRQESLPFTLVLPKGEMPAGGYPFVLYVHGSGGLSTTVIDRGRIPCQGCASIKGEGPGYVLAAHGFASAGMAMPVNPERVPGATAIQYLNFVNLKSFRDIFRQGVLELALFLDALSALTISPEGVAECEGLSLPAGESLYRIQPDRFGLTGQSMGGMYTNLFGAVDPRVEAVVPTGAGGFWGHMVLITKLLDAEPLIRLLIDSEAEQLTYMHPVAVAMSLAWETAEPLVFVPRLGQRPLPGHPARSIYEPVGQDDVYFDETIFDAFAVAYGNEQSGQIIWPSMQDALALANRGGLVEYSVTANRASEDGRPFTGVVTQYPEDGIADGHYIFQQLDEVKYQYGCFFETWFERGVATVPAPAPLGTPCPTE